jgi:transposase
LDRFFAEALPSRRRRLVRAVCVDMWEPFVQSLRVHLPHARIVYDKFHVLRRASAAVDETRRAEFFRKRGEARALVRGKRWLRLRSWTHLDREDRQTLRELFALNHRLAKAYLLKEQLTQLWTYTYEGWARRFLTTWLRALRWQRLPAFYTLARLVLRHLDGILAYCHETVPFGKVEAINGNIRAMVRRGRGYRGPRVPTPQGSARHRDPPAPAGRMKPERVTDCGGPRYIIAEHLPTPWRGTT